LPDLLILAHGAGWEQRFQATSLAASAAAAGREVVLALFFGALERWVAGGWDHFDVAPPLSAEALSAAGAPALSALVDEARGSGRLTLYACSASMRFLKLASKDVQSRVDVIAGWTSFQKLVFDARQVVTF
jgi:predicted peroxiredoxin